MYKTATLQNDAEKGTDPTFICSIKSRDHQGDLNSMHSVEHVIVRVYSGHDISLDYHHTDGSSHEVSITSQILESINYLRDELSNEG